MKKLMKGQWGSMILYNISESEWKKRGNCGNSPANWKRERENWNGESSFSNWTLYIHSPHTKNTHSIESPNKEHYQIFLIKFFNPGNYGILIFINYAEGNVSWFDWVVSQFLPSMVCQFSTLFIYWIIEFHN